MAYRISRLEIDEKVNIIYRLVDMCTVTKVAEGFVLVTVTNDRIRLRVTSFVIVGLPLVDPGKGLGGRGP